LLGIASALRERWHIPVFPAERQEYERCYAMVRAEHDASEFKRSLAAGSALERQDAIDRALTLLETTSTAPR
jgi:hypothetical protein